MIFERMWYEWNASAEMNVGSWCNIWSDWRSVILVRMWYEWNTSAKVNVGSWCNIWSDERSVILHVEWPREREMVVRIDTRFHGPGRC